MLTDKTDIDQAESIAHFDYQAVLVSADIEDYSISTHNAGGWITPLYFIRRMPVGLSRFRIPRAQGMPGIRMLLPKTSQCRKRDHSHGCTIPRCSQNGNNFFAASRRPSPSRAERISALRRLRRGSQIRWDLFVVPYLRGPDGFRPVLDTALVSRPVQAPGACPCPEAMSSELDVYPPAGVRTGV